MYNNIFDLNNSSSVFSDPEQSLNFNTILSESINLNNNKNHTDNDGDFSNDEFDVNDNEIYLSFLYQSGQLACCYYDLNKKSLFYMIDVQENNKFELTDLLIDDLNPNFVITSSKTDQNFIKHLKLKCKYKAQNETNNTDLIENEFVLNKLETQISFIMMPNNDFNYEISKERILSIQTIENMPLNMNESQKIIFFSGLFDFDSKLMIKSVGGLLKYLSRNKINFEYETNIFETPILSVRPLSLKSILVLDTNSFKSLQIFNDVDLQFAFKQTYTETNHFRTHLNDKFNNTLYSLYLSKIQTKIGIGKLRSFMLKPTRDLTILEHRHKLIEFFLDYKNQDLVIILKKYLKKCKYISPILKRMRITKCNLNEFKRLFKTTQSFLEICKLALNIHKKLYHNQPFVANYLLSPILDLNESETTSSHNKPKEQNFFFNIISNKYEYRFEFLVNLFEKTIDLKESIENKRIKINHNISPELDQKKLIYSKLPEYLTEVAHEEISKYGLNSCKITYLQIVGFLVCVKLEDMFDLDSILVTNLSQSYNLSESICIEDDLLNNNVNNLTLNQQRLDSARERFEMENNFKFVFKSNDKFYYKTQRCIELDLKLGDLATDINCLESQIVDNLQSNFIKYSHIYADMIDICAELDCLLAFSSIANEYNYTKPKFEFNKGSFISAKKTRHALVELNFNSLNSYIPNDIESGPDKFNKIKLITGPNASGKTVYLKQAALIIYMSMIGSFVPASEARIGDFDRIYTRLNSNECISLQMSSFSIDLKQISDAVNGSSNKSLILIDEFGKGTNLFDGQALVAALIRYWINQKQTPHVLLSTHFYEMLQNDLLFNDGSKKIDFLTFDYMIENENKSKLVFLYNLKKGLTKSSYALNIAKQVNLPEEILIKSFNLYKEMIDYINNPDQEKNNVKSLLSRNENSIKNFELNRNLVKETLKLNESLKTDQESEKKPSQESIKLKAEKWRNFLKSYFLKSYFLNQQNMDIN